MLSPNQAHSFSTALDVRQRLADIGVLYTALGICRAHHADPNAVFGRDRHKSAAAARRHIWMVLRHTLLMSYPEIGRVFGVDHTSVLYGVRRAEGELCT